MSKLRIKTCDEFENALRAVPFAKARLAAFEDDLRDRRVNHPDLLPYALWGALREWVGTAVESQQWTAFHSLLQLYDSVQRVGKRSEMFEACYVAFLEDVYIPNDPAQRREFFRHSTPVFLADIKRDRRIL